MTEPAAYTWQTEAEVARLPEESVRLLLLHRSDRAPAPPAGEAPQPKWVADALANGVDEGKRNAMAIRLAGYFVSKKLPPDVIKEVMAPFAERCVPPLEAHELAAVIASAQRYVHVATAMDIDTPPTPERIGSRHVFTWDLIGVSLSFAHLHQERDGLKAEVDVQEITPDGRLRRIHRAMLNLSSTQSQTTFAKRLSQSHPTVGGSITAPEIDWPRVLEQTIGLVVDLSRQGEPVLLLRDVVAKAQPWLMYPLLPEDGTAIIFAHGGSGKSYLAQAFGLSLQCGRSLFPAPMRAPDRPRNVLYLDYEDNESNQKARMVALWDGAGMRDVEAPALCYMRGSVPVPDMVDYLQTVIHDHNLEYLIVDSLGPAAGGDLNDAATAIRFFGAVRPLNVGVLAVAHMPKEGDTVVGTVMWENLARNTYRVVPDDNLDGRLNVSFIHHKINNGAKQPPFRYTLSFTPGSVAILPGTRGAP